MIEYVINLFKVNMKGLKKKMLEAHLDSASLHASFNTLRCLIGRLNWMERIFLNVTKIAYAPSKSALI